MKWDEYLSTFAKQLDGYIVAKVMQPSACGGIPLLFQKGVPTTLLAAACWRQDFISVKVSIIRLRHGNVQPECGIRQHAHTVAHHGHAVERRLTVEEHGVAVQEVAVHNITLVELDGLRVHVLE